MDIITASVVLLEQSNQLSNIDNSLNTIARQIVEIASQTESAADVSLRIKAAVGSANIQLSGIESQKVLVQQALDALSALVG